MSDKQNLSTYAMTAPAVLAFPSLLTPRKFKRNGKEQGEAKYGGTWVFDPNHPDVKGLKDTAAKAARAKWPSRPLSEVKFPFKDGNKEVEKRKAKLEKEGKTYSGDADFMLGKLVLKAASKYQPGLAIILNGKPIDLQDALLEAHKGKFYFGVETLAQFNFVAYDAVKDGDPDGVTCYVNKVLSLNKGERLSGGASAAEVFKGYVGQASPEDPTAGSVAMDDEIPF